MRKRGLRRQHAERPAPDAGAGLFQFVAEREGFEPSAEFYPCTRLAGEHHRPLGHLSGKVAGPLWRRK
jgi:hypothetical protein